MADSVMCLNSGSLGRKRLVSIMCYYTKSKRSHCCRGMCFSTHRKAATDHIPLIFGAKREAIMGEGMWQRTTIVFPKTSAPPKAGQSAIAPDVQEGQFKAKTYWILYSERF